MIGPNALCWRFTVSNQLFPFRQMRQFASLSRSIITPSEAGAASHALSKARAQEEASSSASMATILSHAGLPMHNDSNHNQALSPPINLATTYVRPPDGDYGDNSWIYTRESNPTRKLLEDVMGQLETTNNNESCTQAPGFAFSSGMAAISSVILAHKSPVKVLIPTDVYHGLPSQFATTLNDHGVLHQSVDMTDCKEFKNIITEEVKKNSERGGSLIVWLETPSNPLCQVTNISQICDMVKDVQSTISNEEYTITTAVDSTWAPPCITQPLTLGADVSIHSGTKYLGGHSDVLLGIVCTSPYTTRGKLLSERVKAVQTSIGSVPSPFECWLTLRGLRTLHLRVERCSRTAMKLAEYLERHSDVVKCHYPGLKTHPQHQVATQQMKGFKSGKEDILYGGMLSFEVESEAMAMAVAAACRVILRATSLGGTETLIEHRASIEPPERRVSPPGLLRVSVGLEDPEDLKQDLGRALEVATKVCNENVV